MTIVKQTLGAGSLALVLAFASCAPLAGIDKAKCTPGCVNSTTRLVCDGNEPRSESCATDECAIGSCQAGECKVEPAVGKACGPNRNGPEPAHCNEGYACVGPAARLTAIREHTCLVDDAGKVWCWGLALDGELGNGARGSSGSPVLVRGLPRPAIDVSAGYVHTCAVLDDGSAYCWGDNTAGQCGSGKLTRDPVLVPFRVPAVDENGKDVHFTNVTAGQGHTCALTTGGTVYCWGDSRAGQCGVDRSPGPFAVGPTKIEGLDNVVQVETVKDHTCVVRSAAPTMECWGSNSYYDPNNDPPDGGTRQGIPVGKLGPGAAGLPFSATPVAVDLGMDVIDVGMSYESTNALTVDRTVYAWGLNANDPPRPEFQLGIQSTALIVTTPTHVLAQYLTAVSTLQNVREIARTDGSDQCVELEATTNRGGRFMCWGQNDQGELGIGTEEALHQSFPIATDALGIPDAATHLVRAESHGCVLVPGKDRTEVLCFGAGARVGNGTVAANEAGEKGIPPQVKALPVVWNPGNFAPTRDAGR